MTHSSKPRTVVITGAAGALGQATALHFAVEGARLALIDRREDRLRELFAGRIAAPPHLFLSADVTSEESLARAAMHVMQAWQRVDVLIHVAGGFESGDPVHALGRAAWERLMDLNAWSFVALTKAFVPPMLAHGSGKVIAVSAGSAGHGGAHMAAYIASKSALQRLVESLSHEVRAQGINVNSIAPTVMDTPSNRQAMPDANRSLWVPPALAAQTIGFLASEAAASIHGQHVVVGG